MKTLRIKDNQRIPKDELVGLSDLIDKISNKSLKQLEREGLFVFPEGIRESDDLEDEQTILTSRDEMYYTGNVMGIIGFGNQRLTITSRFSNGNNDYLYQYLLERVMDFPNFLNLETNASQEDRLFNLLLFLFPKYLKKAARKGIYKTYIKRQYNDGNVRGTIDVARHIKNNTPFVGAIAYNQREYSLDNDLTELIRHTIEYIKSIPFGERLLNSVKTESKLIIDATPLYKVSDRNMLVSNNRKNKIRHAFYHEYRLLQQLCIMILEHQKYNYGESSKNVYGIIFDGAWLWEEYMNSLISEYFYHPRNKSSEGGQYLFSGGNGLVFPDFIGRNPSERIIADAKYKPISNIGNKDYLQVLAYMYRFDAKKGYYLYPESDNKCDALLNVNSGITYDGIVKIRDGVIVVKHGLIVPNEAVDYLDFVNKIKENELAFLSKLIN